MVKPAIIIYGDDDHWLDLAKNWFERTYGRVIDLPCVVTSSIELVNDLRPDRITLIQPGGISPVGNALVLEETSGTERFLSNLGWNPKNFDATVLVCGWPNSGRDSFVRELMSLSKDPVTARDVAHSTSDELHLFFHKLDLDDFLAKSPTIVYNLVQSTLDSMRDCKGLRVLTVPGVIEIDIPGAFFIWVSRPYNPHSKLNVNLARSEWLINNSGSLADLNIAAQMVLDDIRGARKGGYVNTGESK